MIKRKFCFQFSDTMSIVQEAVKAGTEWRIVTIEMVIVSAIIGVIVADINLF